MSRPWRAPLQTLRYLTERTPLAGPIGCRTHQGSGIKRALPPTDRLADIQLSLETRVRRIAFGSIAARLMALVALTLVGLLSLAVLSALNVRDTMRTERQATMRSIVQEAISVADYFEKQAREGKLSQETAQERAKEALRAQRFEGSGYLWIYLSDGTCALHGSKPEREGKNLSLINI